MPITPPQKLALVFGVAALLAVGMLLLVAVHPSSDSLDRAFETAVAGVSMAAAVAAFFLLPALAFNRKGYRGLYLALSAIAAVACIGAFVFMFLVTHMLRSADESTAEGLKMLMSFAPGFMITMVGVFFGGIVGACLYRPPTAMVQTAAAAVPTSVQCIGCGHVAALSGAFCPSCGRKYGTPATPAMSSPTSGIG